MTAPTLAIQNPRFYQREYEHDLSADFENETLENIQRAALIALPFLSLIGPLEQAISIGCSTARTSISTFSLVTDLMDGGEHAYEFLFNLALSVASVAGTVFLNPIGIFITTSHDIYLDGKKLYTHITEEQYAEIAIDLVNLLANCAYLGTMVYGSLEVQIAALALQILVELATALEEYFAERYYEAGAHLAMGAIRSIQIIPYVQLLQRKQALEQAIKNVYVGDLREQWRFPSDHLPVGVSVDGEYDVVSWNVMNNVYMNWVKDRDSQGLNGSMLTELDVPVNPNGLTQRDQLISMMIESMIKPESGFIALQECSEPFIQDLMTRLPENWKVVRSFERNALDQEITLYDSRKFTYLPDHSETSFTAYPSHPGRELLNSAFKKRSDGKVVRVINSHIPGNPELPGRFEFAEYVRRFFSQSDVTIALGDNNFERHEMQEAFERAGIFQAANQLPEEVLHTNWPTNIDPEKRVSKAIDHTLVVGASSNPLDAFSVLPDSRMQETIELLQTPAR